MEGENVFQAGTFEFHGDKWKATLSVYEDVRLADVRVPLERMAEEVSRNERESGAR